MKKFLLFSLIFVFVLGTAIVTAAPPFKAPTRLVATQNSADIVLTWDDKSNDEDGFEIERKRATSFILPETFSVIASVATNTETYTDIGVINSLGAYEYRVRAYKLIGTTTVYSDYSNVDSVVIAVPAAPSNLTGNLLSSGTSTVFELNWTDNSDNENGFEIVREDTDCVIGTGDIPIGNTESNTETYIDNIIPTTLCSVYKVRAFVEIINNTGTSTTSTFFGYSEYSNSIEVIW